MIRVFLTHRHKLIYNQKVNQGVWMEGVFVCRTGDVVIRLQNVWSMEEKTFRRSNIQKISFIMRKDFCGLRQRQRIQLLHTEGSYEIDVHRYGNTLIFKNT